MPLYEYKCDSCGYQFETRQGFNDALLSVCPNCGKSALRRLIEPASIVFKGSGFYVNDHKGNNGAARNAKKEDGESDSTKSEPTEAKPAEAATAAKSDSSGETKAETKSAAKPDASSGASSASAVTSS